MSSLNLCKPSVAPLLARELGAVADPTRAVPGGVWSTSEALPAELCFAYRSLLQPTVITAPSVNRVVAELGGYIQREWRPEVAEAPWPVVLTTAPDVEGLPGRAAVLARVLGKMLRDGRAPCRLVAEPPTWPALATVAGLQVYLVSFDQVVVATRFWDWGQRRMKDDAAAPSRSYLKVEEAYLVLGHAPSAGESVADLGAAPGGWSYSAAQRGARVVAVDNGPLKAGALRHPNIEHRRADAFRFTPGAGEMFDWLFVDLIETPYAVLELLAHWLTAGWCRRFVVNLKFGHHDPVALLERVRDPAGVIAPRCAPLRVRHLYHDREEFTLVGEWGAS